MSKYILFIHAFSGSDATSSFFNHGKKTAVEIIKKYEKDLSKSMLDFYDPNSTKEFLKLAGKVCCRPFYGFQPSKSIHLNEMRLSVFNRIIHSNTLIPCKLSLLPPKSDALYQHSLRIYF